MAGRSGHRSFGHIRKLPSGRWQASYVGRDLQRHKAADTFSAKIDAEAWLIAERNLADDWTPPAERRAARRKTVLTFRAFAEDWLTHRDLKPRTRAHYRALLDRHILPVLGDVKLTTIEPAVVREWYAVTAPTSPTLRAHCYALLRTILNGAVADRKIVAN